MEYLYSACWQHRHDSVLLGWAADTPDPDNFFSPLLSCTATFSGKNAANWCNPQFDSLLNQALSTTDIALRKQYYDAAQSMIINELPLIPIAHGMRFQASSADVEGITLGPLVLFRLLMRGKNNALTLYFTPATGLFVFMVLMLSVFTFLLSFLFPGDAFSEFKTNIPSNTLRNTAHLEDKYLYNSNFFMQYIAFSGRILQGD